MGNYLKMLNLELLSLELKDFVEPDIDLKPSDDHVVGIMNVDLMRIYSMRMQVAKLAAEKGVELQFFRGDDNQKKNLYLEVSALHEKYHFLDELLWIEIREEFGLWDKPVLGIRRGRQVIWNELKMPNMFGPFKL